MFCCIVKELSVCVVALPNKNTAIENIVQIPVPASIVMELTKLKFITLLSRCEKRISGVKNSYQPSYSGVILF